MNINAKQLTIFDIHRMDITTALGFFGQMQTKFESNGTLTAAMGNVWTDYTSARQAYDFAYAQARKWEQTEDIDNLDKLRDNAQSAFLNALKAMLASPNAAKAQAAKLLTFIRDKYSLDNSDEYMKQTTMTAQFIQEVESNADAMAALTTTGLDDWFTDLKQKNADFLAKMNERTEAQAGLEKGIVREKRLLCEAAYRNVVKLANAMSICEVPAGFDFTTAFNLLNAEIEHFRQILARKGISTGSNSGGDGTDTGTGTGSNENENPSTGGSGQGENGGTTTPTTPDTPSDPGTGGGDNNGGGGTTPPNGGDADN
jgi:hypothetical protein